jgi:hypothetical protein
MHEKRHPVKFDQDRTGQWNVETMLAANRIPAGRVDRGLFIEIGFAGQRKDSLVRVRGALVGVNMNGDRLWTALLTRPTPNVRATGVSGNAINVADNVTDMRVLSYRFGTSERRKTQDCDTCKVLQTQNDGRTVSCVPGIGSG